MRIRRRRAVWRHTASLRRRGFVGNRLFGERFVGGLAVGATTASATAWIVGLALTPETRTMAPADRPRYRPRYRPQKIKAPAQARAAFIGGFIAFAALAFFMSLAPVFLAGPLGHPSLALAGAAAFLVFAAAVAAQVLPARFGRQALAALGALLITAGSVAIVVAVQLTAPSLWLFLIGGAVLGVGVGAYFKGSLGTVIVVSDPGSRAGALAGGNTVEVIGRDPAKAAARANELGGDVTIRTFRAPHPATSSSSPCPTRAASRLSGSRGTGSPARSSSKSPTPSVPTSPDSPPRTAAPLHKRS